MLFCQLLWKYNLLKLNWVEIIVFCTGWNIYGNATNEDSFNFYRINSLVNIKSNSLLHFLLTQKRVPLLLCPVTTSSSFIVNPRFIRKHRDKFLQFNQIINEKNENTGKIQEKCFERFSYGAPLHPKNELH